VRRLQCWSSTLLTQATSAPYKVFRGQACEGAEFDILYAAVVQDGCGGVQLTPSSCSASRRCRGITVTNSISQRNATSGGDRPGGRGNAIAHKFGWWRTRLPGAGDGVVDLMGRSFGGRDISRILLKPTFTSRWCLSTPGEQSIEMKQKKREDSRWSALKCMLFATAFLAACASWWSRQVFQAVREPYLVGFLLTGKILLAKDWQDEVFHVRQAQIYCCGNFRTWDPKITTPPGLYVQSLHMDGRSLTDRIDQLLGFIH
jgi:hypothetical protein